MLVLALIALGQPAALHAGEKEDLTAAWDRGYKLAEKGQHAAAAREFERALEMAPRVYGAESTQAASLAGNLAIEYEAMLRYAEAEPLYQRSLEIREAKLGPDHLDVAQSLNNLAWLYYETGRYAQAEPLYQRSLKIRETKLGPDHVDVAYSLNNLALLHKGMGQYAQAEPLFKRSLQIREAKLGPDHPDVAQSLNNLAWLLSAMSEYDRAEPLYQRSLRICEAKLGPDHLEVARSLTNLASLCYQRGRYSEAEALYLRSLKIREVKLGRDHPHVATVLDDLACMYETMGQYAQAEPLFQRSLEINEATLGPKHPGTAIGLNSLAWHYYKTGRYAEAEPLYQRSLKIKEASLGLDHPSVADCVNNLALLYFDMAEYAQAEPLYQRSLKIREAKLGPDHPRVAASLNNLAVLYKTMGQFAQAEPLYQRSLKIKEAKLGPDHPSVALALNNLALLYEAMGEHEKAAAKADAVRRIVRRHAIRVLPMLSARGQLDFIEHTDLWRFQQSLSLGWRRPVDTVLAERSAGWLINGKAVVQESLAEQTRLARDNDDQGPEEQRKRLAAVRGELAALSQTLPKEGNEAAYRARLAKLSDEERELWRQVNLAAGRPALDEPWVEVAAIRAALEPAEALVDIVRLWPYIFTAKKGENYWQPARYVAWVTPAAGKGDVRIVDLGEAGKTDTLIEAARQKIQKSAEELKNAPEKEEAAEQSALDVLSELARRVLHPLLPAVGDARQLIISPDSQLWLVPWAALPVDDDEYAIERWKLRYVTSGRDIVMGKLSENLKRRKTSRPRVFANPDYDLDGQASAAATRAVLRGKEKQLRTRAAMGHSQSRLASFPPLRATALEAKLIVAALETIAHEPPTIYSEQFAQEGVLKTLESPQVLVLSTHGFYFSDQEVKRDDERRALADAGGNQHRRALLATDGKPLENPLLRCGLALAGCNKPRGNAAVDDGIVTGMEIVGLDLRGTDLVVLSACDTGVGQVRNGEGVAGLRQAFQLAGASAVVSTLWKIPNQETVALMNDFFHNLAAGQSKAEALRAAQLAEIKARRHEYGAAHPFFWAAFTLTGN